jgi:WD40 repeat protein
MNFSRVLSFTTAFIILSCAATLFATTFDGSSSIYYNNYNAVFHNNNDAIGRAYFTKGFTILPDATGKLSISTPVYNVIDLRTTGTLYLGSDLILDSGITFSNGGNIWGNNHTIFLTGNTRLPDNSVFKFINNTIIDGQGHDLVLGNRSQFLVDGNVSVTFKNMTLKNTLNSSYFPPISCLGLHSYSCFDNVTLSPNNDFIFSTGQMFVHNDVVFTGTSKFSYRSTYPCYIAQHSNFIFNPQTIFEVYSTNSSNQLIQLSDKTSSLFFDDCSLFTTSTGFRLTKGSIFFDNKITLSISDNLSITDTGLRIIDDTTNTDVYSVAWRPDGNYLAIGTYPTLNIYSFTGTSLTLTNSFDDFYGGHSIAWSPNGNYLALGNDGGTLRVYSFNGSSLVLKDSRAYGTNIYSVAWSPNGSYLAIGGRPDVSIGHTELEVYAFDGTSLTITTSAHYGNRINSIDWQPNNTSPYRIAVGGTQPITQKQAQVYSFNGSTLTLLDSKLFGDSYLADQVYSVAWSPNGSYLAIGGDGDPNSNNFVLYSFNGSSLSLATDQFFDGWVNALSWLPDGSSVTAAGFAIMNTYSFNGSSLSIKGSQAYTNQFYAVDWSPNGQFIASGNNGSLLDHHGYLEVISYTTATQLILQPDGLDDYSVDWNPNNRFLAVSNGSPSAGHYQLEVYSFDGSSFSFVTGLNPGAPYFSSLSVAWSPDGTHLAFAAGGSGTKVYTFNGTSLTLVASNATIAATLSWSPDGKYLVSAYNSINVFSFNGSSLSLLDTESFANTVYSIAWAHDGFHIAVGGYTGSTTGQLLIYTFNGSSLSLVTSKDFNDSSANVRGLSWSAASNLLAIGGYLGAENDLQILSFNGSSLTLVTSIPYASTSSFFVNAVDWHPLYPLLAVGANPNQGPYNLEIYSFNNSSLKPVFSDNNLDYVASVAWNTDGSFLAIGGLTNYGINSLGLYSFPYQLTAAHPSSFENGIIFGNSVRGSTYDLNVHALSAARINLYGKLWQDSVNNSWTWDNRDSYLSLNRYDSKFKITNDTSINQWKNTQIIKSSEPNTLFLQDNQIWETSNSGYNIAPLETFEFMGDLIIPDNQIVSLSSNTVIDGQGHNLILGKYAQLVIDHSATVTFKNMTIKNTLNTIGCPPIRCAGWYSKVSFDNTTLSFNNDWAFRDGQFFIINDVNITGTSKFSYRSVRPSYITQHSNLIFDPNTTFEFYPSTTDKKLIQMADKTSAIIFDGSTLQTTDTGIRLTKGSLYFDNKITLSTMDNTLLYTIANGVNVDDTASFNTVLVRWSPDGRYLVSLNNGQPSTFYLFDGSSFTSMGYVDPSENNTSSLAWSPDGKYLVSSNSGNTTFYSFNGSSFTLLGYVDPAFSSGVIAWSPDGNYLVLCGGNIDPSRYYRFNGSSFTYIGTVDSNPYSTTSVAWSPSGKYLVLGNSVPDVSKLYRFDGNSFTYLSDVDATVYNTYAAAWSPDGNYLVFGNFDNSQPSTFYRFNGSSFTSLGNVYPTTYYTYSIAWSPDGKYFVLGNYFGSSAYFSFNGSSFTFLGYINPTAAITYSVAWSPDGKFLALGNATQPNRVVYTVDYKYNTTPQGFSNGITLGNSSLGSNYDLDVNVLANARINIFGTCFYDNVN